jgi:pyridinium-3,5-biscarboxylic acid mononucleotide sulfurtransferase
METTYEVLTARLKDMDAALVAFSGGVDSTLLLAAARDALSDKVLAVTATSPTFSAHDFEWARRAALQLGVRWVTVETDEFDDPLFRANPPNRCYLCKRRLFGLLLEKAREENLPLVLDATNVDDLSDFRPGLIALRELGIRSPFVELGLGKKDIRRLAQERGLENWERPSSACLASRIPYGEEITIERLERIARAEASLRELGFLGVRVRDHGSLARIELVPDDLERLLGSPVHHVVVKVCKEAGYAYVTLDLQGYRTGSMNETIGG